MGIGTVVALRTLLLLLYVLAQFRVVHSVSPSILGSMVIDAVLVIVIFGDVARRYFENIKVEVLNRSWLTLMLEELWN